MDFNSFGWKKRTAKVLVNTVLPLIDGYTSVIFQLSISYNLSAHEIVEQATPRFVNLVLLDEGPCWPDFYDLVYAEVKSQLIKSLRLKLGLK